MCREQIQQIMIFYSNEACLIFADPLLCFFLCVWVFCFWSISMKFSIWSWRGISLQRHIMCCVVCIQCDGKRFAGNHRDANQSSQDLSFVSKNSKKRIQFLFRFRHSVTNAIEDIHFFSIEIKLNNKHWQTNWQITGQPFQNYCRWSSNSLKCEKLNWSRL